MKTNSILAIILGLGLIGFVVYGINNYNKTAGSATSKIVVDIVGVLLIIGGVIGIWRAGKMLAA